MMADFSIKKLHVMLIQKPSNLILGIREEDIPLYENTKKTDVNDTQMKMLQKCVGTIKQK